MLEEILALLLSLFSLVSNETPRVSLRETSNTQEESEDDDKWLPYINEEYNNVDTREELTFASLLLPNEDLHPVTTEFLVAPQLNEKVFGSHFGKPYGQVSPWHSLCFLLRHSQ